MKQDILSNSLQSSWIKCDLIHAQEITDLGNFPDKPMRKKESHQINNHSANKML